MAFRKALTLFPTFVVILMVLLMPYVLSSRIRLQAGTAMAENTATITVQGFQTQAEINSNGSALVLTVEDSARQVPTGPDPLHHHNNPTRP
ncbi:hypothetical protein I3843_13G144400 [Carya illinoinensis]|uniref:Uncharacterized protein n=1 Tax=Carya illinoinensis TaxID=32201 RepID=A0A8T1NUK3_CARIL|nr:hypothetical protein CIPAW_13G165100 [Carya illinoinensis]KAG6682873.1 hypothetical protein I3842_13G163800 [Carya illinoinensis]KAG7950994.1 hypothetical protein I3843_13G144400 [Carya illinoinensis]